MLRVCRSQHSVSQPVKLYTERNGSGTVWYRKSGGLACIIISFISVEAKKIKTLGTLPAGMRPVIDSLGFAYVRGTTAVGQVTVGTDGSVAVWSNIATDGYFSGSVTFPLP